MSKVIDKSINTESYIYKLTLLKNIGPYRKGAVYVGQCLDINKHYFTGGRIPTALSKDAGKDIFKKEVIVAGKFNGALLNELEKHYIRLYASDLVGFNLTSGGSTQKKQIAYEVICAYCPTTGDLVKDFTNRLDALAFVGGGTWFSKIKEVMDVPNKVRSGYMWRSYKVDRIDPVTDNGGLIGKKIVELDISGNIVATFKSIGEAERKTDIGHTSLSNCCANMGIIRGRVFRYANSPHVGDGILKYNKKAATGGKNKKAATGGKNKKAATGGKNKKRKVEGTYPDGSTVIYDSYKEAALAVGVGPTGVVAACNKIRPTAGGLSWKYIEHI